MTLTRPAPGPSYGRRAEAIRRTLADAGLDGLIVTHPPNLQYLTGFDGSLGALLLTHSAGTLIVDGRYITAARERSSASAELRWLDVALASQSLDEAVADIAARGEARAIGIEAAVLSVSRFERLKSLLEAPTAGRPMAPAPPRLVPTEGVVEGARITKDAGEMAILRKAGKMLSAAATRVLGIVVPGRREVDVAAEIDALLREVGFSKPAFETIVASGPNSALPHARPGGRRLAPGDSVVLDFGGVYDGYCVDLTRTVQLPPASATFLSTFDAVRDAQAAAIAAIRPGSTTGAVDAAARQVLAARGLGEAFVHGTGHGLGLEVHEAPRITKAGSAAAEPLRPGMVFTVEPGAYLPGRLGVRIEDDVVVTEEGCELLTSVPIDPMAVGSDSSGDPSGGAGRPGPAGE